MDDIDDEEFVTGAVNCGRPAAAVDGEDAKARLLPKFPETPYCEVPLLRATRAVRSLSLIGLSPDPASSSRLSGKQRNRGQTALHFRKPCVVACWDAAAIGALRSKPPANFPARANWSPSDVTEKQSQRPECHFGVTGMISVCTRYRQPAGRCGAPSVRPNPSELRARFGNKPAL